VAATDNSIPAAVAAFNAASGQAIEEIVAWTLRTGTPGAATNDVAPAPRHHRRHR